MKRKEDTKEIIKEEIRRSDGFEYIYRLIVRKSARVASYKLPLYSIRIELNGNGKHTEYELTDIFADGGKAVTFFQEMVDNLVTPIDLPFILEDKIMT